MHLSVRHLSPAWPRSSTLSPYQHGHTFHLISVAAQDRLARQVFFVDRSCTQHPLRLPLATFFSNPLSPVSLLQSSCGPYIYSLV